MGAVLAALPAALPMACMQANAPPPGPVAAGNVADVQVGALQVVGVENVILGRDVGGLYAMTRVCTHQGQLVAVVGVAGALSLHCYGHGSDFDANGAVTNGPAGRPLEHFKVDLGDDGSVTIQGAMPVAAAARTTVT